MKRSVLYAPWGGLFIICAGLGFIQEPAGFLRFFMTALSIIFFAPPAVLLYRAGKEGDRHTLALVRNLSLGSLGLTLLVLVVNVLCSMGSETLGNVLHGILIMVSSPMVCSGYWALSLFLWACLLMVSLKLLRKK